MNRLLGSVVAVALVGCGSSSGSGVSSDKKLVELSASERTELCAYVLDITDAPRTVMCDGGRTVEIEFGADCDYADLSASCAATVSDAEGCAEALADDACEVSFGDCAALFSCVLSA